MSDMRQRTSISVIAIVLGTMGALTFEPGLAASEADATLHIRSTSIPPSDLWSAEFRDVYAGMVARSRTASRSDPHPKRDASKAEWDQYDAAVNAALAKPLARARKRYPVEVVDTRIGGVRVGIVSPKGSVTPENSRRVLINLHGGGFVDHRGLSFGQLESIPVAAIGKFKVITVDYRQSPYFQYPAASQDVEAVYRELLKEYKPEAIGIFGCSAGGALTSQVVAWFQKQGLPRPGAIGIFCAELKQAPMPHEKGGDSKIWGLTGVISESGGIPSPNRANRWYMESADPNDPIAYPGLSDAVLVKFPPTLFLVGTRESPMSLAAFAHARLLKLGVDSALYLMEGAWHAAHVTAVGTPEAHDANAYIARWFDLHLARS